MINWIRRILGFETLDKAITDNNTVTQSNFENISTLLEHNSNAQIKLEQISNLLGKVIKENVPEPSVPISQIKLNNGNSVIDFKLDNNFQIDENWAMIKSSSKKGNLFSQAAGTSTIAASTAYSTTGLYTATASVNSLMTYSNGTLSSMTMNGSQIGTHAGFAGANAAVFTPILAFQFASMITGQYYFKGLSNQLTEIHKSVDHLISLHHNERLAKLRYINIKISELNSRTYFTVEDYISIDTLKFELSTIRFEYLLSATQELTKSLLKVLKTSNDKAIELFFEDIGTMEKLMHSGKEQLNKLWTFIDNQYKNSILEKRVDSLKTISENTGKKAANFTDSILESKYFFYSELSLNAEHLFQLSKLLEFKMNLSDKEPNANRIGKIGELYGSIAKYNLEDSVFDELEKLNMDLYSKLEFNFDRFEKDTQINKGKIIGYRQRILNELDKTKYLIDRRHLIFRDIQEIKSEFEVPKNILIDNREGRAQVYVKTQT